MDHINLYERLEYLSELIKDGNDNKEIRDEYVSIQKLLFPNYAISKEIVSRHFKENKLKPFKKICL